MGPTTGGTAENLPELDERLYHLDEMESDFLSKHMGIKEPEKLKEHIFSSQAQVYKVKTSTTYHILKLIPTAGSSVSLHSHLRIH